jgi:hypothetical protein
MPSSAPRRPSWPLANSFKGVALITYRLVDRVIVTDEDVEIRYVVPTSPNPPYQPFCQLRTDYLDRLPMRKFVGKEPPLAAGTSHLLDGVHNLLQWMQPRSASWLGWGQEWHLALPLSVGQVCQIRSSFHNLSLPILCLLFQTVSDLWSNRLV